VPDEVKPLKRGGLVRADNGLGAERHSPPHLEPAQCPAPVASGIQTASAEEAAFQAVTGGPHAGDYVQADDELDVVDEGFGTTNGVSALAKEPLDLELDEIGRGESTGAMSFSSPQASSFQTGNLDELEVWSMVP
jgi:hypothetical protein